MSDNAERIRHADLQAIVYAALDLYGVPVLGWPISAPDARDREWVGRAIDDMARQAGIERAAVVARLRRIDNGALARCLTEIAA